MNKESKFCDLAKKRSNSPYVEVYDVSFLSFSFFFLFFREVTVLDDERL